MAKLFEKNRITSLLRVFFAALLIFVVSGCGDYDGVDAYEEYKKITAIDEGNLHDAINKCFYCKIFLMTFESIDSIATNAVKNTREAAATLLALCFGLWLLAKMFLIFTSMKQVNLGEQWADIITRVFWLIVISTFLSSDAFMAKFFDYTVVSLFEGAVGIAVEFTGLAHAQGGPDTSSCANITSASASGIIPRDVGAKFACLLLKINQVIYKMQMIATVVKEEVRVCTGSLSIPFIDCTGLLPYFAALFMILLSFLITLFYPVYLLDAVIRAGIVAVLIPFFMAAFVFPSSRQFARMAFQMIMNMVFGTIILTLVLVGAMYVMDLVVLNTYINGVGLADIHTKGDEFVEKLAGKSPQIRVIGLLQIIFLGTTSIFMIIRHSKITNIFAATEGLDSVLGATVRAGMRVGKVAWEVASVAWDVASVGLAVVSGGLGGIASVITKEGVKEGLVKAGGKALAEGGKQALNKGAGVAAHRASNRLYSKEYMKARKQGNAASFKGPKYNPRNVVGKTLNYKDFVKTQFKNNNYDK
jgi:hypothetical protein